MTPARTTSIIAITTLALLAAPAYAAGSDEHDAHHPAPPAGQRLAQAPQAAQGMGMGMGMAGTTAAPAGYAEQMKAMQAMHDKMLAAKTPEERNALMAEQMKLMQDGMAMMGGMGPGPMHGMGGMGMGGGSGMAPMDMATRQQVMEKRMEMMQSMMQMMMDRMGAPATQP